jgi:hypothetical protein
MKTAKDKITLSLDRPTGNFWVDTGLVVLLHLHKHRPGEYSIEEVRQRLIGELVQKTGNKDQYYDEKTGRLREYEKRNWVYPTNLFIKASGKAGKKRSVRSPIPLNRLSSTCNYA